MSGKKAIDRLLLVAVLLEVGGYKYYKSQQPLVPRLVSKDDYTRNMASAKLTTLSKEKRAETISALLAFQNDPDAVVRRNALYSLRQLGEPRPEVVDFCVKSLGDPDKKVQDEAFLGLSRYGEAVLPNLTAMLGTAEGATLAGVARVLVNMEARAVPSLVSVLKDPASKGVLPATQVLVKIGAPARDAAPVLKNLLGSDDPALRLEAAEALNGLGLLPKSVTASLAKDLLSSKESFSDPRAPRPRLAKLLESVDPRRRTLMDLGFDLKQRNSVLRYRAAYVMSEMSPPNIGAMEMAVDALADTDVTIAARAMLTLTRMGLDKTERLKKIATPRMRSATRRAQAAKIEGFDEIVVPAMRNLPN